VGLALLVVMEDVVCAAKEWAKDNERLPCACSASGRVRVRMEVIGEAPGEVQVILETSPAVGCVLNFPQYTGQLVKHILCERVDGEEWHKIACIDGECTACGWENRMPRCPAMYTEGAARWREYVKVPHPKAVSHPEKFGDRKLLIEKYHHGTRAQLMEKLEALITEWIPFNFTGNWVRGCMGGGC
jgi:hypothetical protein